MLIGIWCDIKKKKIIHIKFFKKEKKKKKKMIQIKFFQKEKKKFVKFFFFFFKKILIDLKIKDKY